MYSPAGMGEKLADHEVGLDGGLKVADPKVLSPSPSVSQAVIDVPKPAPLTVPLAWTGFPEAELMETDSGPKASVPGVAPLAMHQYCVSM